MITVRSFVVLGLSLIAGLANFGHQIGRAVKNGREFDRFLTVRGLSEREMKATVAIWPIQFAAYEEDLGALKSAMERDRALVIAFLTNNGVETKEMTQGLPDVIDRQDARIRDKSPTLSRYQGLILFRQKNPSARHRRVRPRRSRSPGSANDWEDDLQFAICPGRFILGGHECICHWRGGLYRLDLRGGIAQRGARCHGF